jgi:23S rRNA pseudouridine2605 synthase
MGGRIAPFEDAVAGPREHLAVLHNDRADRHLAAFGSGAGLGKRQGHEIVVGHCIATIVRLRDSANQRERPTVAETDNKQGDRIAKVIARAGVCSRRDAEKLIAEGRVSLDGETVTTPGVRVGEHQVVTIDGKPLAEPETTRLWRYHKPAGLVTSHRDPQGRPTVFANLPKHLPRVVSIGRLDINSEGLLLLTNDGSLARRLELPAAGWVRKYRVRLFGKIAQPDLDKLAEGVTIAGVTYGPVIADLERSKGMYSWATVSLKEGKNREVKRLMESLGLKVARLIRVQYGPFHLGQLPEDAADEIPPRLWRDQLGMKRT